MISFLNLSAAWEMLRGYVVKRPRQAAIIVVLYVVGGLAEGVSILSLLPLVHALQPGAAATMPAVITNAFAVLHLAPTVGSAVLVIVGALVVKSIALAGADFFISRSTSRLMLEMRVDLLQAVGNAQWEYFVKEPPGQLANVVSREIETIAASMMRCLNLLAVILQALTLVGASFLISWKLTIAGAGLAFLVALLLNRSVTMARTAGVDRVRVLSEMMNTLVDGFQGFKALKAMAREQALVRLLSNDAKRLRRAFMRNEIAAIYLSRAPEALVVLMLGGFLYFAMTFGGVGLAEIAVIAALGYRTLNKINAVQKALQKIVSHHEAYCLVLRTQTRLDELRERHEGSKAPVFEQAISFERVSFSYGEGEVLSAVDLNIPASGLTVLIGSSGAGKSTIVDLVLGLRHATSGRILIDSVPIKEIDIRAWRSMVGFVPQEVRLFDRSLFENVALDEPSVTRADVEEALRQAGARNFVNALPQGIDSPVGQAGLTLSGGERQRIALARALVHRPRLLLLDEATSALDPETERRICTTLKDIAAGTAILAISHQPRILEIADRAYRIDGGEVRRLGPEMTQLHEARAG